MMPDRVQRARAMQAVLARHEIARVDFHATGPGGWWVPIAVCACGHSSPPECRASHLAYTLADSAVANA